MKKLITTLFLVTLATAASAQHCCYRTHYHWGGPGVGWIPLAAGVVIGAELASQPRYGTVVVEQPVYVQQPVIQAPPPGYHWQEMVDPATNTKKIVLVPNQ